MPKDDLRNIRSFDHAIEVLGGTGAAARRLGRTSVQVCQWRVRYNGRIPAELFVLASTELAKEGYRAPLGLFKFERSKRTG